MLTVWAHPVWKYGQGRVGISVLGLSCIWRCACQGVCEGQYSQDEIAPLRDGMHLLVVPESEYLVALPAGQLRNLSMPWRILPGLVQVSGPCATITKHGIAILYYKLKQSLVLFTGGLFA